MFQVLEMKWLTFTIITTGAQYFVSFDYYLDFVKLSYQIAEAYEHLQKGTGKDLTSIFQASFLERFDDLYQLEQNKNGRYLTTTISKFMVGWIIMLFLGRGVSKKVQLMAHGADWAKIVQVLPRQITKTNFHHPSLAPNICSVHMHHFCLSQHRSILLLIPPDTTVVLTVSLTHWL